MSQLSIDILKSAQARITDHERHARGALALNEKGEQVNECSEDAVAWCAMGSLRRAVCDQMDITPVYSPARREYLYPDAFHTELARADRLLHIGAARVTDDPRDAYITFMNEKMSHGLLMRAFNAAVAVALAEADKENAA